MVAVDVNKHDLSSVVVFSDFIEYFKYSVISHQLSFMKTRMCSVGIV